MIFVSSLLVDIIHCHHHYYRLHFHLWNFFSKIFTNANINTTSGSLWGRQRGVIPFFSPPPVEFPKIYSTTSRTRRRLPRALPQRGQTSAAAIPWKWDIAMQIALALGLAQFKGAGARAHVACNIPLSFPSNHLKCFHRDGTIWPRTSPTPATPATVTPIFSSVEFHRDSLFLGANFSWGLYLQRKILPFALSNTLKIFHRGSLALGLTQFRGAGVRSSKAAQHAYHYSEPWSQPMANGTSILPPIQKDGPPHRDLDPHPQLFCSWTTLQ